MLSEMLIALGRKALFTLVLLGAYWLVDHTFLSGFDTGELVRNEPRAVADLLGLIAIAIALS